MYIRVIPLPLRIYCYSRQPVPDSRIESSVSCPNDCHIHLLQRPPDGSSPPKVTVQFEVLKVNECHGDRRPRWLTHGGETITTNRIHPQTMSGL